MRSSNIVIDDCRTLARLGAWPSVPLKANPERWLQNFTEQEMPVALALLESFVYVPEDATKQLLVSAYRTIPHVLQGTRFSQAAVSQESWDDFRSQALVTYPTGEEPSPTDSGHLFVRWGRDILGIAQANILEPVAAAAALLSEPHRPLVIIDDFAGSGDQFIATWTREIELGGVSLSLASVCRDLKTPVFYVAAIVTWKAKDRIRAEAPQVTLCAGHLLSARYSVFHPQTVVVAPSIQPQVRNTIAAASRRGGIPPAVRYGYRGLGLALAFSHTQTDAALGVFWYDSPTWKALTRHDR